MKVILWSIRTFWYKGLAKIKEKIKFEKRRLSLKNSSPDSKADFRKVFIWYLGYNIECVAYKITDLTYKTKYLIYKRAYSNRY